MQRIGIRTALLLAATLLCGGAAAAENQILGAHAEVD
jgi:hypothetical protein